MTTDKKAKLLDKILNNEGISNITVNGKSYVMLVAHHNEPLASITKKIIAVHFNLIVQQIEVNDKLRRQSR
jgi:ABC-type thiamine transport system ATPase subunit